MSANLHRKRAATTTDPRPAGKKSKANLTVKANEDLEDDQDGSDKSVDSEVIEIVDSEMETVKQELGKEYQY